MRSWLVGSALVLGLAAAPGAAYAISFTGTLGVDAHTSGDGLIIDISLLNSGNVGFDLSGVGDSVMLPVFIISTPESDVGVGEDTIAQPITAAFAFSEPSPPFGGDVGGDTNGASVWSLLYGFIPINAQSASVVWNGPLTLYFGPNGDGRLVVSLSDEIFNEGLYGLGHKGAKVKATFTLDALPTEVPIPPAMALFAPLVAASGLGSWWRRRRRIRGGAADG